jgi:hypothetical protein
MKTFIWLMLAICIFAVSSCGSYKAPTNEEMTARKDAYVACKTATKVDMQITDIKDGIILKLLDKLPGNDACAELITSSDKAQVEIAKSNNDLGGKGMDALKIVGSIFALEWGNTEIAKSVGASAGIHAGRDAAGGNISYPTTTTTTTTTEEVSGSEAAL